MASAATVSKPRLFVSVVALILLVGVSAVQCYDGRRAVGMARRRSRLGITRHVVRHHRRTSVPPHRYVLAETTNSTAGGGLNHKNHSSPGMATSNVTAPAEQQGQGRGHGSHRHRMRNWIIGFVVGSLSGVISGLGLSVLFWVALNCARRRYRRSKSGTVIFTPKLIKRAEHLAFLEKEDGLVSLAVIGRGGCGEVFKEQLPVEREGEEPRFIAIKKVKERCGESRQLDKWTRQIKSEIRTVGHIRHRNLLPLAAHVTRPDCHYLVYEYMKNGSLHHALKPDPAAAARRCRGRRGCGWRWAWRRGWSTCTCRSGRRSSTGT